MAQVIDPDVFTSQPCPADGNDWFPQYDGASKWFKIANCFQNEAYWDCNWSLMFCICNTIAWFNYLVISCLIGFLLAIHCIMYKKINKRCSLRILTRNRV